MTTLAIVCNVNNLLKCHTHKVSGHQWPMRHYSYNIFNIDSKIRYDNYCLFSNKHNIRLGALVLSSTSHFIKSLMSLCSKLVNWFLTSMVAGQVYRKCGISSTKPVLHCLHSLSFLGFPLHRPFSNSIGRTPPRNMLIMRLCLLDRVFDVTYGSGYILSLIS